MTTPSTDASDGTIRVRVLQLGRRVLNFAGEPGLSVGVAVAGVGLATTTGLDIRVNGRSATADTRLHNGDVVTLTDAGGFAAKPFRLAGHAPEAPGLWAERLVEYDPALYADVVATGPLNPDTSYPSPSSPPTVASLAATEQFYSTVDGSWASRVVVSWADPSYPPLLKFVVEVFEGSTAGALVFTTETSLLQVVSAPLKERQQYAVRVTTVSTALAQSAPATTTITPQGKFAQRGQVAGAEETARGYIGALGCVDLAFGQPLA